MRPDAAMKPWCLLVVGAVALAFPLGCSGGSSTAPGDDRLFVPEDLPNTPQEGEIGVTLKVVAFTLQQGPNGPQLFAAVKNEGTTPSCNPGMVTEFFDKSGQSVASVGVALKTKQLYALDSSTFVGCIDPGQVGMSASTTLPSAIVIEELGSLKHNFPTFGLDGIVPVAGFTVGQIQTVAVSGGSSFKGTFTNGLEVTVKDPNVTIFPVNRVGRPLGVATSSGTTELAPGGTWSFETSTVTDAGADQVAYPSAMPAVSP
jgi:hypothetical protein